MIYSKKHFYERLFGTRRERLIGLIKSTEENIETTKLILATYDAVNLTFTDFDIILDRLGKRLVELNKELNELEGK